MNYKLRIRRNENQDEGSPNKECSSAPLHAIQLLATLVTDVAGVANNCFGVTISFRRAGLRGQPAGDSALNGDVVALLVVTTPMVLLVLLELLVPLAMGLAVIAFLPLTCA